MLITFCIRCIGFAEIFDLPFLIDLHILGYPECDLTLSSCFPSFVGAEIQELARRIPRCFIFNWALT